ncbi:MAG TPA: ABC transporter substrate-binding protein [bacterium]|nr:ABC transporter substrate-binding protein [bacterium]
MTVRPLSQRLIILGLTTALAAGLLVPARPVHGQQAPIKIGTVFAVTGPGSSLGRPEKDTATMLQTQLQSAGGIGGRPVQIITYDSESDPTKAVLLIKKAVTEDNVVAVVGGTTSPESQAMADYAMSADIPFMSVAASTTLSVPSRAWVFQMPQRNATAAAKALEYLVAIHAKTFAFLYRNDDFGQDGLVALRTYGLHQGVTLVDTEPFAATDTDLSVQVARARVKNPDAMVVWSTPPTASIAAKNIRQLGMNTPIVESHGIANKAFIQLAGPAAEGVVFPAGKLLVADRLPASDPQKALLEKYAKDFEAANKYAASTFGGHAYDGITMLADALRHVGPDKAKIREYLEHLRGFLGTGGVFNMSPQEHNGLSTKDMVLVVIKNGNWDIWK